MYKMVLLVLPANIEKAPYVQIYIDLFVINNINFEIAYWDRLNIGGEYSYTTHVFRYCFGNCISSKIIGYRQFSKFVIKVASLNKFDFIIVFTLQSAIFLSDYLLKEFPNKYIIDIRDYSFLMRFFHRKYVKLLGNSRMNVVSSMGFLRWLPISFSYDICHNLSWSFPCSIENLNIRKEIVVLTIGQLRDYSINAWLISQLKNKNEVLLQFSGDGNAKEKLQNYVKKECVSNAFFSGAYIKKDEGYIVSEADFINILLPNNILSNTLMSNRFYLALLYRKPMLVNASSEHAEYVYNYKLGIVVKETTNLYDEIVDYVRNFNRERFCENCELLLDKIRKENSFFAQKLLDIENV